ncbi:MAG: PhoH family protein [Syntrophomonadaceae bacterium]|nr:PhoH family protein [Syntrophomonadaceae bacterium]
MAFKESKYTIKDNQQAAIFFGSGDENFHYLQEISDAELSARGADIYVSGPAEQVDHTMQLIADLMDVVESEGQLNLNDIGYLDKLLKKGDRPGYKDIVSGTLVTTSRGKAIKARTIGQKRYVQAILRDDVVFGIGPAGTGKTYLAVAMAVRALRNKEVERIILVRPAVEAGEKLGFLPGDFIEKVNPYLRPLYDGLFDILGVDVTQRYLEKNIIEIAPLAYMRGRTLNSAFIILDEAQNTTPQQMKMFLTRLGFGSQTVITGDVTQVDLPRDEYSGLIEIQKILGNIKGISFEYLGKEDVVRHPLVQKIINAYELFQAIE